MKKLTYFLVVLCLQGLFSCDRDSKQLNSVFSFVLSDGNEIVKNDIQFYDSATHFLFLKKDLDINQTISGFSVLVNNDTIYKGAKQACIYSSPPRTTFYITDCCFYGSDIVDIGYYPYSRDLRNDQRVIIALKTENLLRNGLSCGIDSIDVKSFDTYSEVFCKITITNHDNINYYIPDPGKMGELHFNYYTGGLLFQNVNTKENSFLKWSISDPGWTELSLTDFSLLLAGSKLSFTFKSSDYYKMGKGLYKARYNFCGINLNSRNFDLEQNDGRIWVGTASSVLDNIMVK